MALFGGNKDEKKDEKKSSKKKEVADVALNRNVAGMLLAPRITEKAAILAESGTYVFDVPMQATKEDVAQAVEVTYKVTPKKITMVRMRPQNFIARMRGRVGRTKGFKKAYVHVQKGDRIEVL